MMWYNFIFSLSQKNDIFQYLEIINIKHFTLP